MRCLAARSAQILVVTTIAGLFLLPASLAQRKDNALRSISGHVLNHEHQPLAKAVVYLKNTKTLNIRSFITEQDGAFKFAALAPNVDYEVYADWQGGRSEVKTLRAFDSHQQVEVTLRIRTAR